MKKNIISWRADEFCWSFQNKMKLPMGHSTWTVYIFFFNFFFPFSQLTGSVTTKKSPSLSCSWEIRDSSIFFLFLFLFLFFFFFFFYFVGSLQCIRKTAWQHQIPQHQKSEKNSLHRKYFTFGQDVKCT